MQLIYRKQTCVIVPHRCKMTTAVQFSCRERVVNNTRGDRRRDWSERSSQGRLPRQSPRVYTTGDRRRDDRPVYTPYNLR